MLTREWPPDIYGGAGVHVEHLVAELRRKIDVDVHCCGEPRGDAIAHAVPAALLGANPAIQTLGVDLEMVDATSGVDILHSHTWYANLAGHIGGLLHGVPHVLTAHSLEPLRPWKEEQLGGGYRVSSWVERTAYEGAAADHRRQPRHARRRARRLPGCRPRPRVASSTTASTPTSTTPTTARTPSTELRHRREHGPTCCSSGASRGRRASST